MNAPPAARNSYSSRRRSDSIASRASSTKRRSYESNEILADTRGSNRELERNSVTKSEHLTQSQARAATLTRFMLTGDSSDSGTSGVRLLLFFMTNQDDTHGKFFLST